MGKSLIGSKLGPIEMGKIKDYKGTKMDYASENEFDDMLTEKTHVVIKKKWGLPRHDTMENITVDGDDMEMEMDSDSSDEDNLFDSPTSAPNPNLRSIKSAFAAAQTKNGSPPCAVSFKRGKSMTPTSKPGTPRTPNRQRSSTPGTPKRSRVK